MTEYNNQGEDLTTIGFLSPRELAGLIIDASNSDRLDDLITCESVTLAVFPILPSTQTVPSTIKLITPAVWKVEEWIKRLLKRGLVMNEAKDRPSIEEFLISEIRNAFPDSIDNGQSKLPRGYKWRSPSCDL